MKLLHLVLSFIFISILSSCQNPNWPWPQVVFVNSVDIEHVVDGPCQCCDAWRDDLPEKLDWQTKIAPPNEPGERLEISGTIFQIDGKTPAEGVILYVYQTDAEGVYSRGSNTSTCANRHGLLRGWMKTGKDGRYQFSSIRPGSYPNTDNEQHIHPIIKEPNIQEYWIDEFVFADDPKLTSEELSHNSDRGGSGLVTLEKNEDGTWVGKRDIILGKNVEGY